MAGPTPGRPGRRQEPAASTNSGTAGDASPRAAGRGAVWENVKSVGGAIFIFLFVRLFIVEAFRIPSGSMVPTLLVGDWLFVNKLVYGPHIPFVAAHLPGYAEPKRGEVVVFVSPTQYDNGEDSTPTLVKRLWGLPGDTVYMRNGILHINGTPYPQAPEFAVNEASPDFADSSFTWQRKFAVAGSRFGPSPAQPTHDNWGPMLVPQRHFFMMGDNRYHSKDSRYWGFVPRDNLRGRPLFVYYSYDTESGLDYFRAVTEIRWTRIGHWIR